MDVLESTSGIVHDLQHLVSQEILLAKTEAKVWFRSLKSAVALGLIAFLIIFIGAVVLASSLTVGLWVVSGDVAIFACSASFAVICILMTGFIVGRVALKKVGL